MIEIPHVFNSFMAGVAHGLAPMTFWLVFLTWREVRRIRVAVEGAR